MKARFDANGQYRPNFAAILLGLVSGASRILDLERISMRALDGRRSEARAISQQG
jgi:hypothetical protein